MIEPPELRDPQARADVRILDVFELIILGADTLRLARAIYGRAAATYADASGSVQVETYLINSKHPVQEALATVSVAVRSAGWISTVNVRKVPEVPASPAISPVPGRPALPSRKKRSLETTGTVALTAVGHKPAHSQISNQHLADLTGLVFAPTVDNFPEVIFFV